jgi:DNA repair protein RecN (Recombination protein N)
LIELSGLISESIDGDDGLVARMGDVQRAARELERLDPSVAPMLAGLATAAVELEDLSRSVGDYRDDVDVDPEEAAVLEERINLFESLKRKYGDTLGDILEFHAKAAARLSAIQNRSGELDKLEADAKAAEDKVVAIAESLSDKRRKAAPKLAKKIETHLKDLGFKQSKFGVDVDRLTELGPHGGDGVEFQFMPNPGEPAKPLRLIGSSGEISRVMLAVKSALADQDKVALLVFDEIDANVGGEVAHAVGAKMAGIADRRQVIVITHLAQVAARGHQHFVVDKVVEGKRTHSKLNLVEDTHRVDEIARMLGGMSSESGRKHAEELLAGAG